MLGPMATGRSITASEILLNLFLFIVYKLGGSSHLYRTSPDGGFHTACLLTGDVGAAHIANSIAGEDQLSSEESPLGFIR